LHLLSLLHQASNVAFHHALNPLTKIH